MSLCMTPHCFSAHLISCYFRWDFVRVCGVIMYDTTLLFSTSHFMLFQMRFWETSCGVIITLSANQISSNCKLQDIVVSINSDHNSVVFLGSNSHKISFYIIWLASQPIRALQIPKYLEKMWDFRKFSFHLNSKVVTQLC